MPIGNSNVGIKSTNASAMEYSSIILSIFHELIINFFDSIKEHKMVVDNFYKKKSISHQKEYNESINHVIARMEY